MIRDEPTQSTTGTWDLGRSAFVAARGLLLLQQHLRNPLSQTKSERDDGEGRRHCATGHEGLGTEDIKVRCAMHPQLRVDHARPSIAAHPASADVVTTEADCRPHTDRVCAKLLEYSRDDFPGAIKRLPIFLTKAEVQMSNWATEEVAPGFGQRHPIISNRLHFNNGS